MGKGHISKNEAMLRLGKRKDVITIPFENKTELIQLVATHLSYQYQKSFRDLRETNQEEYRYKRDKIPRLVETFKILLKRRLKFFRRITINSKSLILKRVFKKAKINDLPENSFKENITYQIKGLEFQIIKERR